MAQRGAKTSQASPPAGTGQVPGLGEAFRINLNTGQGAYSYKLPLPEGVARHTPQLSLEYAHGNGHGPFGFGWKLDLRRIGRRLDYGAGGDAVERYHDGGAELVKLPGGGFGPVRETAFTRYSRTGGGWRVEERNGTVHELGMNPAARTGDPDHPDRVTEWLLERTLDASGNEIAYSYETDGGTAYPAEIRYAVYAVRFLYEERPDVRVNGRAGYLRRVAKRCRRIELYLDPGPGERLIRSWTFTYTQDAASGLSFIASIQLVSHGPAADGSEDVVRAPVRFTYSSFASRERQVRWMESEGSEPPALSDPDAALVTLDEAPLPGILQVVNGRQHYWRNRGDGSWAWPVPVEKAPRLASFARDGVAFLDADASGTADLLIAGDEPLPGYYENGGRRGWVRFVAYPRGSRARPDWRRPGTRVADADGNGRIDAIGEAGRAYAVWINNGEDGWSQPLLAPKGTGDEGPDAPLDDPSVHLADVTGDGLQDIVRVRSGRVEYWPSLGHGRYGPRVVMRNSPRLRDLDRLRENLFLIDIDGDGCADLVFVTAAGIEIHHNRNGAEFGEPVVHELVPAPIPGTIRPVDLLGEGRLGLLYNSRRTGGTAYVYVSFGRAETPHLLTRIDNGTGLTSEIFYRPASEDYRRDCQAGELWDTNFPFPLTVVAGSREVDATSGQTVETEYRYHEGHYEPRTRQFQGFRRSERIEKGDESRTDTRTVFHFLMAQERRPGRGPEHAHLNGMLRRTEVYGLDGSPDEELPYTVEEADYGLRILDALAGGEMRVFVFVTARRTEDSDRSSDLRGEERTYDYDGFGNVTRERLRGYGVRNGVPQPERIRVTETEYATAAGRWLIDKPSRITVRDAGGAILTEIRRYYDGAAFTGLPLGQADRGLLTREERLVLPGPEFQTHYQGMDAATLGYHTAADADGAPAVFIDAERHAYDARGLRTADRDALGHDRRYDYDASGLLRVKLTDALGETRFDYDRAVREPVRILYADGAETRLAYDAQGRVTAVAMPGEPAGTFARTTSYDDVSVPNSRTTRFRTGPGPGDAAESVMYFDGRGAELQERIEAAGGQFVVSNTAVKNPWGDRKLEFEPYYAPTKAFSLPDAAAHPVRRFFFDARGRVTKTADFSGGVSTARYLPFEIVTADANDNDPSPENQARGQFETPRREEFDVLRNRTLTVEAAGSPSELPTRFRVGPRGELLEVSDSHGVLASYTYDRLGNRLAIRHREAGDRRIWFDARRKAVRMVDGRGRDLRAVIDARGRLVRLSVDGAAVERYRYDDPAQGAHGKLAEVSYPGGRQVFHYDAAGRLERHEHHFDGRPEPHVVSYEYDLLGRETARDHAGGPRVEKRLTPNGWVQAIPGVLDEVRYDARGLPVRIGYANGVVTEMTYTPGPGRLETRRTTGPGGQRFEDVTYEYDRLGMLLASEDTAPGGAGRRAYAYDPLYQVTELIEGAGAAQQSRTYSYTGGYNLARFDEAGVEMHYDDPLHPDRVAGITPSGGSRFDVAYDANGNVTALPGQRFDYDYRDLIERFDNGSGLVAEYRYDHKGIRVSKRVSDGGGAAETFFVSDLAEIRNGVTACFVTLGHLRVGILHNGTLRFVHSDYLGSTAFYSDAAGTKISSIAYRPFGNLASASGDADFRTFGIHPVDAESGLVYMKRRYYSPRLGRFLSPDPLAVYRPEQYLSTPKGLHPYIYAGNDPLNKADLDGYSFWSVVGAIVGVIAAIAVVAAVILTGGALGVVLGIALAVGLVAVSYVVADATAGTDFGEFMRGFLIGLNAGFNAAIATVLFGPAVGLTLGVINFLAAFDTIANSEIYQGILGWSSWLMPMSWLATGVGLIFFLLNVIPAIFTLNMVPAVSIQSISIDWGTGTIVMEGGWTFLPGFRGGFNLGNFAYITPGATVQDHETGHTLNVAAFGSIFHFIGALDENAIRTNPADAYAERLAESNDPATTDPDIIPMWV